MSRPHAHLSWQPILLATLFGCTGCDLEQVPAAHPVDAVRPSPSAPATPAPPAPAPPASNTKSTPSLDSPRPVSPSDDRGVFSEKNDDITTSCPSWLEDMPRLVGTDRKSGHSFYLYGGIALCEADIDKHFAPPASVELAPIRATGDKDPIPRALDILRGAKKTVANSASYKSNYRKLEFPAGDVPETEGVCTDVIIRALRNDALDLQEELQLDLKARPASYPMVTKADPNIDHRRVRTLLPYFQKHFRSLPPTHTDSAYPLFPGDIVFMNTMGDAAPEHLGIVSDQLGSSGHPQIINNWTDGHRTAEMDLLGRVPVTHRFRIAEESRVSRSARGLEGALGRSKITVPDQVKQVVAVITPGWNSSGGTLRRYERKERSWVHVGSVVDVRVGRAGLGTGRGIQSIESPQEKAEGDKRAPAGLFALSTAFGTATTPPYSGAWPFRAVGKSDYWVDEPDVPTYNTWQTLAQGQSPPWSAERLSMYSLGLVVQHNTQDIRPGAGSAIFLHPWKHAETPTVGCTAMDSEELKQLLAWLDPEKSPVLLQTAGHIFSQ